MSLKAALFLIPALAWAQIPGVPAPAVPSASDASASAGLTAPADVDQALRARVTEFFEDFVDGKFREAMSLVAKDTQDEYFNQGKEKLLGYKIQDVKWEPDFEKAVVDLLVKRNWRFQGQDHEIEVPMATTWEIEDGKWVWYHHIQNNSWVTPMGPTKLTPGAPTGAIPGLPAKLDDSTLNAAAQKILGQAGGVDKPEITLASDKASSEKVTFHNNQPGPIHLDLYGVPTLAGFTAKLDKTDLSSGQDAVLEISYNPPATAHGVPPAATLRLVVVPFNRLVPVQVKFAASAQ